MTHADRGHLKTTFNQDAELYDRARPSYADELFEDLIQIADLTAEAHLLEIGCGTGKATLPLAQRGYRITCVELGDKLAAVARRNLAAYPDVSVITSPFETWDASGHQFELVYAVQAWHWLDPTVSYGKVAHGLKPRGHLAITKIEHAFPRDADPFFFEIQDIYHEIGEDYPDEEWPPPLPEDLPDMREEIESTGLFAEFQSRRYLWEKLYTAEEYIDLMTTASGHIAMEPEKRDYLFQNMRERINARQDPRIRRHALAILNVAKVRERTRT